MKLKQTPGGTWCGTEKDWKAALKAEGFDPKTYAGRSSVDVPVDKAGLMEFLTFHNVNVIEPRGPTPVAAAGASPPPLAPAAVPPRIDIDEAFTAAPIATQLRLAVSAIDAADDLLKRLVPENPRES